MAVRFPSVLTVCRVILGSVALAGGVAAQTQAPATPTPPGVIQPGEVKPPAGKVPPTKKPVAGAPVSPPQGFTSSQMRFERVTSTLYRWTGQVEIAHASGVTFHADEAELDTATHVLTARGNVVVADANGRISAERIEFDTKAQTGTFYDAAGIISLGMQAERVHFGNQDPDVYFYGETVAKIGEKKYRITRGGFTTCVQPTPRWELVAGTVTLNLQDYAVLKNTVLRVKGVPVFYFPFAYYPLDENERNTGFLLPSYGSSSLRGQAISNAFFWAVNRSHDATLFHDWFSQTGQGYGTEYRYVTNPQSSGNLRVYRFDQRATAFEEDGVTGTLPDTESFEVRANATQTITRGIRARARVDYFSELLTQQLYHQNLYDASRRGRTIQGAITGAWGPYNAGVAYDRSEAFSDEHRAFVYGSTPRVNAGVAPTRLFGGPVYGSVTAEYANQPYHTEIDGVTVAAGDKGLSRIDVAPLLRVPFSRWTFLTLNTSAAYRLTRYSESLNAEGLQVPEPFLRSYVDVRADAVGPVFTKIWDAAPDSHAERYKHVIEPTFNYQQTTPIEDFRRTPLLSNNADFIIGSAGRITYGLTNRLLRRDKPREGAIAGAREFLSIGVQQTYYSDEESSRYDPTYASSTQSRRPVDLSPVALTVRYSPAFSTTAQLRMEHDVSGDGLLSLSASGNVNVGPQSINASLSRRRFSGSDEADTYLSAGGTGSVMEGRLTGMYSLSWDITRSFIVSQTMMVSYFAQCCGFGVEFQNFNYPQITSIPISSDQRINFSFTLAGLGTFSNFFGAFGGNTGR